jgi:hypothetical protein
MTLSNAAFEELNHQNWGALTGNSQGLSNYISKKAAVGAGKYLYQSFNVIGKGTRRINARSF